MVATRAQTAPRPTADALLTGNLSMADRLLEGSGADQLQHTGPCGLTTTHLAVMFRWGRPDIVAALAAAGAPLNTPIECGLHDQDAAALREMCGRASPQIKPTFTHLQAGYRPLALAARWEHALRHSANLLRLVGCTLRQFNTAISLLGLGKFNLIQCKLLAFAWPCAAGSCTDGWRRSCCS